MGSAHSTIGARRTRLLALVLAIAATPAAAGTDAGLVVDTNPYVLGQAADWLDGSHVVWHDAMAHDEDGDGEIQIHRSALDGSDRVCLTCGLDGPNQVPVVQPRGPWILFHSWNGHQVTIGGAGFGGLGSDLWVMRRDGSARTKLTNDAELHDNFHAYWSSDGRYIAWTALNWNAGEGGTGKSDIRVARFDPHGPGGPRLVDEHVVRPGNGHWYETQWWAPDGSGFLYTETVDTAINPELFFCRLRNRAHGVCEPRRLTNDPAWDEQAIFTPDMRKIVFMSSRDLPGAQNDWSVAARLLSLPAEYDFALILWTQNKFADGVRVDEACVAAELRSRFVGRLSGVATITQIPLGIAGQVRAAAADLVRDPKRYAYQGACGGSQPDAQPSFTQETTRIGRFAE